LALAFTGVSAQEVQLPPGILLLSRIKRHVRQELEHLPEYTCLQTVQRYVTREAAKGRLEPLDTLRLEILYTGHRELYASPGAQVFREQNPAAFVAGGMIGDGIFAIQLHTIFVSETALFTYRGEDIAGQDRGWARAVKYDFRVPARQSGWNIQLSGARGVVGERGSFWADPETLDLLRVEIHADDIPAGLPLAGVIVISDYARMRIGADDIMLPQAAGLRLIQSDGAEALDQFEFTHCRSYQTQSSISFEDMDAPDPKPAPAPAAPGPTSVPGIAGSLPAGLVVPVTLTTAVQSDSTVGTLLEGRVSANVDFKGKTLIPEGAPVHGRIRRLERYQDAGGYFVVGLEFTEVEAGGSLWRFYADLQNASGAPGLEWVISTGISRDTPGLKSLGHTLTGIESITATIHLPDLPGVGSFFIRGTRFALPAGFRMLWKTRALGQ
jgi:hypothetical protein